MKLVRHLPVLLLLSTAACVSIPPHVGLAAPEPAFGPITFFTGTTIGDGLLKVDLSRARPVHVVGDGHVDTAGTLVLVQRIEESGRPTRTRVWHLHRLNDVRYSGTLSDARGPVVADVHGNLLHIRFTAKGGLGVEQWLYLQPDGKTALNRMVVRKFGIVVAALRVTIRRAP